MNTGLTNKNERNADADSYWILVLQNDHVNTQLDVVLAIYDFTSMSSLSINTMLQAHIYGSSVIGSGSYSTVNRFQKFLNSRNLTTSIILVSGRFSKS